MARCTVLFMIGMVGTDSVIILMWGEGQQHLVLSIRVWIRLGRWRVTVSVIVFV